MRSLFRPLSVAILLQLAVCGFCEENPNTGSFGPAQAAADVLRERTNAEIALLPSGVLKDTFQKDNLASMLEYPSDALVVLSLTGAQIRQALERSVSLYPQPNVGFLQLSGLEVTFKKSAPAHSRIVSAMIAGSKLDDSKSYNVAMPASLQRGLLGYSKIWDKAKTLKTSSQFSMQEVLKGHKSQETSPRWLVQD